MRKVVLVIACFAVTLVVAGTANALQFSRLTVRDTGETIRWEYRLCAPELRGERFMLRFELKTVDGETVLDHTRRYHHRFPCQNNFFFVTDIYEPGQYRARVVAEPPNTAAVSTRWQRLRITSD
jgi:hypothetical protein